MIQASVMSKNPLDIRVVVTGLGTVNPIGNTVKDYWNNLKIGKNGIRTIQNVEIDDYSVRIAGEVDALEASAYFKEKKIG